MNERPKILIVDDRPENLVALEVVLKNLDVELIRATSGNEALKATLNHDFALALLDIQMPEMDGYELAEILREEERTTQLPFIFISAVYTDNLNMFKGYEKGAFSFITKPFQPEILINKVKFFVEKHQQEIQLHKLNESLGQKNSELEFAVRELESFSYSVSHDLRAPLRAMNGFAEILRADHGSNLGEDGLRVIKTIRENAMKMSALIDSLLFLSKMGKKELVKKNINTNLLIEEVMTEFNNEANSKTVFNIKELPSIFADRELIKQVFVNLISNAIKYSQKQINPKIEIGYKKEERGIIYYIKDNGVGFDMKYYNKLFGVFQRLHNPSDFEGVGIGLANVQRIVVRHGGKVWAEGKENDGATFYFTLP